MIQERLIASLEKEKDRGKKKSGKGFQGEDRVVLHNSLPCLRLKLLVLPSFLEALSSTSTHLDLGIHMWASP